MIGRTIAHYQLTAKLGAGGMGEVYLAEDTRLDRKVALKLLPSEFVTNEDRLRRFVQEAKAAAALNHPNIAHIYEVGESDGTHFIAMEFVDGDTLTTKLHREKGTLGTLLKFLSQVAEGLAKAHAAGIVHRDLKPDNIMITRDGYAKILDFGLAKLIETRSSSGAAGASEEAATAMMPVQPLSAAGSVMGTVGYMSPEQAQGKTVDQRSDIFSFGCVLYEAATGRRPFEGDSAIDTLHKIIYAAAPPVADFNPDAPADLQRIVRRCLAKDPEKRYQTIRDVANDLEDLSQEIESKLETEWSVPPKDVSTAPGQSLHGNDPHVARATSSAEYIVSEIKRRKTGAFVTLALFILAGLGYAIYHFTSRTPVAAHFLNMKITRVTSEGNVESAAVSPDGKYIAYSLEESGKRSLWTKHLSTGSRVQIVPTTDAFLMNASMFSHDGGYVYYTRVDEQNPQGALYQVPVLGGASKKILANVAQPVSLSPDGKQLAFGRYHLSGTEDELWLANADGTNERRLITVKEPEWLGGAGAAWSPDGKMLAVGYGSETQESGQYAMTIAVVSIANATLKPITSGRWPYAGSVTWFSDGSALAFVAREEVLGALQIWQVSYPQGQTRRVTNDLNSYALYSLTVTGDSSALVSVQSDPVSNIWVAPEGDMSRARGITPTKSVQEGHYSLAWTPDGKVVYDSNVNSKGSIWIVNADGSDPKPLTESATDDFAPEVSPDGRYVVFNSNRAGGSREVWRMDIDGANPQQLTQTTGVPTFSISPDGRWVIYNPFVGGLQKVSIDGGSPIELVAKGSLRNPQASPDGKLLAYFFDDEQTKRPKIAVVEFDTGVAVRTLDLPVTSGTDLYGKLFYRGFHWSPDGRALVYINKLGGVSNLWSQPLDGSAPKQITDFKSDLILNFAYSRDGRQLAFARGNQSRDAVLISEVK